MYEVNNIFKYDTIIVECGGVSFDVDRSSIEMYENSFLNGIIHQMFINPLHYPLHNGRRVIKLSDAKASILKNKIDVKRAVFNAVTKGIKLCTVENGFTSSTKLLKILNWGVKYGNDSVTVKRFARKGKYYTGVWVKGVRGMQSMEKYKITKKDVIYNNAKNNNLVYDNDIWSNDY